MFREAFEKLELADTATILDQVNPLFDGLTFDPVETTVMAIDMEFYPGFKFLDIADHASLPAIQRFVVYSPQKSVVINFTNDPIYMLNRDVPVRLTKDNVEDYLRFFFTYVRGQHGRFLIVESVDDIHWKEDPPPSARKAMGGLIIPVTLNSVEKNGTFKMSACMIFKDSLFKSNINIKPDGFVELDNEELLVEDVPVLDDTFGQ